MADYDAIVIGGGHNAARRVLKDLWSVARGTAFAGKHGANRREMSPNGVQKWGQTPFMLFISNIN